MHVFSFFGKANPNLLGLVSCIYVFTLHFFLVLVFSSKSRRAFKVAMVISWISALALIFLNWWHYQYFQSYFNYQSLALSAESSESLYALSEFAYTKPAVVLVLVSGLFLFLSIRFYKKEVVRLKRTLPLLLALIAGAAVSGTFVYNSVANYRALNMLTLSPAYFSPVHAFFIPLDTNKSIQPEEIEAADYFARMNAPVSKIVVDLEPRPYNVIVVMLESVRASMLGVYSGRPDITPQLNRFAKANIVASNFYANTNFTVKAETAILCGILDHNAKPPLSKYSEELDAMNCLPAALAERGYSTRFYHGYQSRFYSRDQFLPKLGFNFSYFHADHAVDDSPQLGWGISDEAMYSLMLDDLEGLNGKPFFAHITTLSSHYPFHWDWPAAALGEQVPDNTLFKNYTNAVAYEDYAFGQFWQRFQQSPLAKNTILVVTADHGVWTFSDRVDQSDAVLLDEQFFRMPLVIYHPDVKHPVEIAQVSSQLDIAPTLAAMLGISVEPFIGKNMLQGVAQPWALMMKSGQLVVREQDTVCRIVGRECAGLHQECVAHQFGELFLQRFTDMQACFELEGDLLRGGSYHPLDKDEPWMPRGFNLINLHNKRAFAKSEVE